MKALLEFLSVPVAVIALCVILGVVGGIENGTVSFPAAVMTTALMVGIEVVAFRVFFKQEEKEDGKNPDE